jgi:hypothetical protein
MKKYAQYNTQHTNLSISLGPINSQNAKFLNICNHGKLGTSWRIYIRAHTVLSIWYIRQQLKAILSFYSCAWIFKGVTLR